ALLEAVFEEKRKAARDHLGCALERLTALFEQRLETVAADWLFTHDERLLEPYAWLTEALDALNKTPSQCDALSHAPTTRNLEARIDRLTQSLLQATHPWTRRMLAGVCGELPEAVRRLQMLAAQEHEPEPARMGLSTLLQT